MQAMREVLRSSLGRALRECDPLDRLAAAWPVAAGASLAAHGRPVDLADGVLTIAIDDAAWIPQLIALRSQLAHELARVSGVPVREIHFRGAGGDRAQRDPMLPSAPASRRRSAPAKLNRGVRP